MSHSTPSAHGGTESSFGFDTFDWLKTIGWQWPEQDELVEAVDVEEHVEEAPHVIFFLAVVIGLGCVTRQSLKGTRVPFTLVCFIIGVLIGELALQFEGFALFAGTSVAEIDPEFFLFIFLPLLIFESAYSTDTHTFKFVFMHSLLLAGPGLVIVTALTGVLAKGLYPDWQWTTCFLFGAILSATDPVAVVSLLKELGTNKKISTLIEGESLLNDGVAMVAFNILVPAVVEGKMGGFGPTVWEFVRYAFFAPFWGVIASLIAIFCLNKVFNDPLIEVTITVVGAYLTFYLAEGVMEVSGVLSLVGFGIFLSSRRYAISPEVEDFMHEFWELMAFIANTLVFVISGIIIRTKGISYIITVLDLVWLLVLYAACNVFRAFMLALLYPILTVLKYKLDLRNLALVCWGGLRGAVGLALALVVKNNPAIPAEVGSVILFHVAGIVVLTLIINGSTTQNLVQVLELAAIPPFRQLSMRRAIYQIKKEQAIVRSELRVDGVMADSHWEIVKHLTVDPIALPKSYGGPSERIKVDAKEKARQRILHAFQISVRRQYEEGLLGGKAVRTLIATVDDVIEEPGQWFDGEQLSSYWVNAMFMRKRMNFPILKYFHARTIDRDVAFAYELGNGFRRAQQDVLNNVDTLVDDLQLQGEIKRKIQESIERIITRLQPFSSLHPNIVLATKTKHVAREILNNSRSTVHHLQESGLLENVEASVLKNQIEIAMENLRSVPQRLRPQEGERILRTLSWFSSCDHATQQQIMSLAQPKHENEKTILMEADKDITGLVLVTSGVVRIESPHYTAYIGPGRLFNLYGLLTITPSTANIYAQSPVSLFFFSASAIRQILRNSVMLSKSLWHIYSVRAAFNILRNEVPHKFLPPGQLRMQCEMGQLFALPRDGTMVNLRNEFAYVLVHGQAECNTSGEVFQAPAALKSTEALLFSKDAKMFFLPTTINKDGDQDEIRTIETGEPVQDLVSAQHMKPFADTVKSALGLSTAPSKTEDPFSTSNI